MISVFILVSYSHWYHFGFQGKVCLVHYVVNKPWVIVEVPLDIILGLVVPFFLDIRRDEIRAMCRGFQKKTSEICASYTAVLPRKNLHYLPWNQCAEYRTRHID